MKKILIIEDNADVRENVSEILELTKYKVIAAENGKVGVEMALKEKPDLILCDIVMPVLDGYGVYHMLQKDPEMKDVPFIFLTALTERSDYRKAMEMGADDYITKPFNVTELLNAVESRLKKAEKFRDVTKSADLPLSEYPEGCKANDLLKKLTSNRIVNRYHKKQIIFLEGNRPAYLYYILKGKVKKYKTNDNGKGLVVDLYTEGDFLGHVALLENINYQETAEAMEETELALIPADEFRELINTNHELSHIFIQLLARNISEMETHLLGLAYNSLRRKVADALVVLHRKYNAHNKSNFSINISRENLAEIAGTATESLIRTLSDFRNEKLVDIQEGSIIILNEKKLESMLN